MAKKRVGNLSFFSINKFGISLLHFARLLDIYTKKYVFSPSLTEYL